jgi:hypothetical protein
VLGSLARDDRSDDPPSGGQKVPVPTGATSLLLRYITGAYAHGRDKGSGSCRRRLFVSL